MSKRQIPYVREATPRNAGSPSRATSTCEPDQDVLTGSHQTGYWWEHEGAEGYRFSMLKDFERSLSNLPNSWLEGIADELGLEE